MRPATLFGLIGALALVLVLALPINPSSGQRQRLYTYNPPPFQGHIAPVSQSVYINWYLANPDQAPPQLQTAVEQIRAARERGIQYESSIAESTAGPQPFAPGLNFAQRRFNLEGGNSGLPQNEESVVFCPANPNEVLMGTNDYRGLLDPNLNRTGWHYSNNGGTTVLKEGLLDQVTATVAVPSGGDPVVRVWPTGSSSCDYYASSLAYDPQDQNPSAIALYKTSSATLNGGCSGASCWPAKRAVASSTTGDFLDKEWMDVGQSGSNTVVWVTWTRFTATASPIEASRCTADLSSCTSPIPISASNAAAQFSYVTIAPNGKVYVTWIEASSGLGGEVFTLKMRVAAAGSTTFGGVITLATETQPLGFNTSLADNDFRIVSIPQNTVLDMGTTNRVYVVWPFCQQAILVGTCRDSDIKIAYTDNDGSSFTTTTLTAPGNQYFPGIDADNSGGRIYLTYYSNRLDPWNHRQQVVLAHAPPDLSSFSFIDLNPVFARGDLNCDGTFNVIDIIRALQDLAAITPLPLNCPNDLNEPDADPFLGGLFIGDYIEVFAHNNLAVIGYNANFTLLNYLGTGPATYQQDNYLAKFTYP